MYIDKKGIAESGSHKELLEKGGLYYELYTAQLDKMGMQLWATFLFQ